MYPEVSVVTGAAGCALGFLIPFFAQKTATYKYAAMGKELMPDLQFARIPLKIGCAVFNAAGWMVAGLFAANWVSSALMVLLWTLAIVISIVDIRIHIIPNEAVLVMAILGAGFQFSLFGVNGLLWALAAMVAVMVVFTVLAGFLGLHTVGAGDVKLAGAMALALGYPYILYGLSGMAALLAAYCVFGMAARKLTLKSMIPFAPFLMTGMLVAIAAIALKY